MHFPARQLLFSPVCLGTAGQGNPSGLCQAIRTTYVAGFAIKRRRLPPSVSPLSARATNIRPLSDVLLLTTRLKQLNQQNGITTSLRREWGFLLIRHPYHEKLLQRQSSAVALRNCYWLMVSLLLNLMPTLILMKVSSSGGCRIGRSKQNLQPFCTLSALIFRKSSF